MTIKVLFIDLDGTIYPSDNGMWDKIAERMEIYMHQILHIPESEIPAMRKSYFDEYGTTLSGLLANYSLNPEDYLSFVHDIPVSDFIKPNKQLREMFTSLPQPKWILTNSDKNHATRVLTALGVEDLFVDVLGVSDLNFHSKPNPYVYQQALLSAGNPSPKDCLFADDLPKNLIPAWEMGFVTVLVGDLEPTHGATYQIKQISDLAKILERE
jgi:pyrimidine 5'-nucleotidase